MKGSRRSKWPTKSYMRSVRRSQEVEIPVVATKGQSRNNFLSIIRRSRTFVPVGPVTIASPSSQRTRMNRFSREMTQRPNLTLGLGSKSVSSAIAPAAGLLPSIPSVPALRTTMFCLRSISIAQRRTVSRLRPPRPSPNGTRKLSTGDQQTGVCSDVSRSSSRRQPSAIGCSQISSATTGTKPKTLARAQAASIAVRLSART